MYCVPRKVTAVEPIPKCSNPVCCGGCPPDPFQQQQILELQQQIEQAKKILEKYNCNCRDSGLLKQCFCFENQDDLSDECTFTPKINKPKKKKTTKRRYPAPTTPEEKEILDRFINLVSCTVRDAVRNSVDAAFEKCFCSSLTKLDKLVCKLEGQSCILGKIYADLKDKITYYGERSCRQYEYLCRRAENERCCMEKHRDAILKALSEENDNELNCECEDPCDDNCLDMN